MQTYNAGSQSIGEQSAYDQRFRETLMSHGESQPNMVTARETVITSPVTVQLKEVFESTLFGFEEAERRSCQAPRVQRCSNEYHP